MPKLYTDFAQTFATAKGMVLELPSQFPRLGLCKPFDVSLMYEYPEEKERIISFMYLQSKTISPKPNKNWMTVSEIDNVYPDYNIPLSSQARSIFFAVHLFQQQIFSMSVNLEYWLCAFLYLHCNYHQSSHNDDNGRIKRTKFVQALQSIEKDRFCQDKHKSNKILSVLRDNFENFRRYANQRRAVKIGEISENLKPYFMDYAGTDIHNIERYVVSFQKITKIFDNAREIDFINRYIFDNVVLASLVQYLFKNPMNTIKQIKFLYYDYDEYTFNNIVCDTEKLDKVLINRLKKMRWNIQARSQSKASYEIKLFLIKASNGKKTNFKRQTRAMGLCMYRKEASSIRIPAILIDMLLTGTKRTINGLDDEINSQTFLLCYIIKASSLHTNNSFRDRYGKNIRIFNYDLHDITTGETLYFAAQSILNPNKERGFKWKLLDRIFNSKDIENEFGVSKDRLPVSWKIRQCFTEVLNRKITITTLIKRQKYIQKLINKTPWHKRNQIFIDNKHENRKRITYSIEKKEFMHEISEFMKNDRHDVKLIPVLIRNADASGHHVEFMEIARIWIEKQQCNIALSYRIERNNTIKIVGIYLNKYLILSQHQLISQCHICNCLDDFKSNIHHLTIGNPDFFENNMNLYKKKCNKQYHSKLTKENGVIMYSVESQK